MGVTGLGQFIAKECPQAVTVLGKGDEVLEQFKGQVLGFDTSVLMHRYVNAVNSTENGEHLQSFIKLHLKLQTYGITGVFIFDGKQTGAKDDEIKRRVTQRKKRMTKAKDEVATIEKELSELQAVPPSPVATPLAAASVPSSPAATPLAPEDEFATMLRVTALQEKLVVQSKKATRMVKGEYYTQLKVLFREHKIPFLVAAYEAEQCGAWLAKNGLVDLLVTDDYDALASSSPLFLQHFQSSLHSARLVYLKPILDHLKFNHEQFVDFCILCGTDFGGKLEGIGPSGAKKYLQKYGSIEAFLASTEGGKWRSKTGQLDDFKYQVARRMFNDNAFPVAELDVFEKVPKLQQAFFSEAQANGLKRDRFRIMTDTIAAYTPATLNDEAVEDESESEAGGANTLPKRQRLVSL